MFVAPVQVSREMQGMLWIFDWKVADITIWLCNILQFFSQIHPFLMTCDTETCGDWVYILHAVYVVRKSLTITTNNRWIQKVGHRYWDISQPKKVSL